MGISFLRYQNETGGSVKRLKLKHLGSGRILGEVLEMVHINGSKEYVVQSSQGRLFVRHTTNIVTV